MHRGSSTPVIGRYSCLHVNTVFFTQSRWSEAEVTGLSILVDIKEPQDEATVFL
jgi:hypothetical protein